MIDILKKEIENQYGSNILDRGDCEFIANYILEKFDINISYNTLRRFLGWLKKQNQTQELLMLYQNMQVSKAILTLLILIISKRKEIFIKYYIILFTEVSHQKLFD